MFLQNLGAEISPAVAFLGGHLAQDVINVLGQREQPLQNFLLFDGEQFQANTFSIHPVFDESMAAWSGHGHDSGNERLCSNGYAGGWHGSGNEWDDGCCIVGAEQRSYARASTVVSFEELKVDGRVYNKGRWRAVDLDRSGLACMHRTSTSRKRFEISFL